MVKKNHFLTEHILVTSSFSTAFVEPSRRVRCTQSSSLYRGNRCDENVIVLNEHRSVIRRFLPRVDKTHGR